MKATVWKKQGIQGRPKSAGAQPQGREGTDSHGYWGHRVETVTLALRSLLGDKDPRALEKPCGSSKGEMVVETCVRRQVSCRTLVL